MEPPRRLTIPTCAGCGAIREYESCEGACSERKLELVSGADYDELSAAAAACRARIQAFSAVVEMLAGAAPGPGEWRVEYERLQRSARSVLRSHAVPSSSRDEDPLAPAETEIVWRCPDCGGVDSPQPCLGVCIWRLVDWVEGALYEGERSAAVLDRELERSLAGLLGRLAFTTPRKGQWERNWQALHGQAQIASQSAGLRRRVTGPAIRQALGHE